MSKQKNNKLIAEFMGEPIEIDYEGTPLYDGWKPLEYHESWDWLMPVVEKIQRIHKSSEPVISIQPPQTCTISPFKGRLYKSFYGETTLQATHIAVIEFIKWYNKNIR